MRSLMEIEVDDFKRFLIPQRILFFNIIYIALTIAPLIYATLILLMRFNNAIGLPQDIGSPLYILINAILCFSTSVCAFLIPRMLFSERALQIPSQNSASAGIPEELSYRLLLQVAVIQLALLQGASFFGLICIILGLGWINALSSIPLLIFFAKTFPTKSQIIRNFFIYIKKDPRLANLTG